MERHFLPIKLSHQARMYSTYTALLYSLTQLLDTIWSINPQFPQDDHLQSDFYIAAQCDMICRSRSGWEQLKETQPAHTSERLLASRKAGRGSFLAVAPFFHARGSWCYINVRRWRSKLCQRHKSPAYPPNLVSDMLSATPTFSHHYTQVSSMHVVY